MAGVWTRLTATRRGRVHLTASGVVAALVAGVAVSMGPAIANADKITGRAVPGDLLPTVVSAALSCPALTPPRLAGQLMAASGFEGDGAGLAGLSDEEWRRWKPSVEVQRGDARANIVALAHQTCAAVGTVRAAGVKGDHWELAVAAGHSGTDGVLAGRELSKAQSEHVDRVAGYAAWYADTDQFQADPRPGTAAAKAVSVLAVPPGLVAPINAAGRICPAVTPARIAAQLNAASGFNANLRTDAGEGIAQFSAQLWTEYASRGASVWNTRDAIITLGTAMCDLSNQFSAISGADPYTLALGAAQWGAETIRQAGGLPRSSIPQLSEAVAHAVPTYEKDARLKPVTAEPTPASPAPPSPTPSSSRAASPRPATSPAAKAPVSSPAAPSPTPRALYDPAKVYQIRNGHAGAILELPGKDVASVKPGTKTQLWDRTGDEDQRWTITAAPDGEHVLITNHHVPLSLAVKDASKERHAPLVVVTTDRDDPNQQWRLSPDGGGQVIVTNRNSGQVMELFGIDRVNPEGGTWRGYGVQQWDFQKTAKDQRWELVPG